MPRDFVPCVYKEWDMYAIRLECWQRRYQVIEVFDAALVETHEPYCTMTQDSHAYFVGEMQTDLERQQMTPEAQARRDTLARARLFETFYAAMAAMD